MMKCIRLLMSIALLVIANAVYAQSYTIKSFEGTPVKIRFARGKPWRQLSVSIATDSVLITDCSEIKTVRILKGKFLEIAYLGRGGTGSAAGCTMILSVSANKINVETVVDSFASWFAPKYDDMPYREGHYKAKFTLTGTDKSNYKLHVNVIDKIVSTPHSKGDHNRPLQIILSFDPILTIFYSAIKPIDHVFMLEDSSKMHLKGLLPTIVLAGENYYYFKSKWYKQGLADELFSEY